MIEHTPTRGPQRHGFTLLEVILAMSLLVMLVALIGSAIQFHLQQLTVRKTRIEEAQLARAILRQIADDLRSVVIQPPETSTTTPSSASTANILSSASTNASAATGTSASGSASASSNGAGPSSSSSTSGNTTSDSASDTDVSPAAPPGVYGTAYQLQLDVSRIPRYEEYAMANADPRQTPLRGDVRTVTYFYTDGTSGPMTLGSDSNALGYVPLPESFVSQSSTGEPQAGLARRLVNRGVERYAIDNGQLDYVEQQVELLAAEVIQIEFRYFDGYEWLSYWDTEQMGGLPLAVEIYLEINSAAADAANDAEGQGEPFDESATQSYRLVVALPAADPWANYAAQESSDTGSESSSSATTSSSGGTP